MLAPLPSRLLFASLALVALLGIGTYVGGHRKNIASASPGSPFSAQDKGSASSLSGVSLTLSLRLRNQDDLSAQINNGMPGGYLSAQEFQARYGLTAVQLASLNAFLSKNSLIPTATSASSMSVSGTVASVKRAFAIQLRSYRRSDGTDFVASPEYPVVPVEIRQEVAGIIGLDLSGFLNLPAPLETRVQPNGH